LHLQQKCVKVLLIGKEEWMNILREIGIIARALDSIANIEFRDLNLARGQYLYLVRIA